MHVPRSWRNLAQIPDSLAILLIRAYQLLVSPWLGPTCRFTPSCSHYMVGAIQKYGVVRGVWRGLRRIARCHPWSPGGYDPP